MAVSRDSVATVQITCPHCGERLRYVPSADAKLPPRERSNVPEGVPVEAALHREIVCVACKAPFAVPIPMGDPHLRSGPWPSPPARPEPNTGG